MSLEVVAFVLSLALVWFVMCLFGWAAIDVLMRRRRTRPRLPRLPSARVHEPRR